MKKIVYFDMDGTVYDLYGMENWLDRLHNRDISIYTDGKPLVNMKKLSQVCRALIACGYEIGVISWLAKDVDDTFNRAVKYTKQLWIEINMPYVTKVEILEYGTPKQKVVNKNINTVLVDDNADVRKAWDTPKRRKSIDAKNEDIITKLWELVA